MRSERFSADPGGEACATVPDVFPYRHVFIPLFIIFAAACLLLAGCNDETIVTPDGDGPDGPVCPDSLPSAVILSPPANAVTMYPTTVSFDIRIEGYPAVTRMRHLLVRIGNIVDGIAMLNEHPEDFEDRWSDWETPSGENVRINAGEDEPLQYYQYYLFAVQVMDSCGRADTLFSHEKNARQFWATLRYPVLSVMGTRLGSGSFTGTHKRPAPIMVPPNVVFMFMWEAPKTFDWMGPIEYRFGWDVQNLGDDDEWSVSWNPAIRSSLERWFPAGVHVFYAEARDDAGTVTRARIEIEVIPFPMDRDLLLIDDWLLGGYRPDRMLPSEDEHDEFWEGLCSRAPGFDPAADILPADEMYGDLGGGPVPLERLSRYRHVIWTFSNSLENAWKNTIRLEPDPEPVFRPNTLALYLAGGGSALTCGRSDYNESALGATFPDPVLMPASIINDFSSPGPAGDRPGRYSMAWDDYYITVVDKVLGTFRTGEGMLTRSPDRDAMMFTYHDPEDAGGMPDTIMLWEELTGPTSFWNPQLRGFYFVEAYDPAYWMDYMHYFHHECYTPLYRMRSRSTLSPLNNAAIALIVHRPECETWGGVTGGESYHFGFPLWYMDHGKMEQLADEIFTRWYIK